VLLGEGPPSRPETARRDLVPSPDLRAEDRVDSHQVHSMRTTLVVVDDALADAVVVQAPFPKEAMVRAAQVALVPVPVDVRVDAWDLLETIWTMKSWQWKWN